MPAARKRFGQHFLQDDAIIDQLIRAIRPRPGQKIVEIGPGLGALTLPLIQEVGELDVIEIDRDLPQQLEKTCVGTGQLTIHQADALDFDFSSLSNDQSLRIVGNLPYNISTPLLFHLLDYRKSIVDMHFMLQQEVVNRLAAQPGQSEYGRLSVMIQRYCQVEPLFSVAPSAFRPPPKVDSAVVRLLPLPQTQIITVNGQVFTRIVTQAFSQRRKTLRNSLRHMLTDHAIEAAGVDPDARPQTLSQHQFAALSQQVKEHL